MLDLVPGVLAGLGIAIPLYLWWLHRQASRDSVQVVPSVDLWDGGTGQDGGDTAQHRNLWWVLRAAICALILAAMAGLAWPHGGREDTVWVDVTPSLGTREADGDRIDLAARAIVLALQQANVDRIRLVAAQDHSVTTDPLAVAAGVIAAGLRDLASRAPKGAAAPLPDGARWLLTDGSAAHAAALASETSATVLTAGAETENAGVTALSARISLLDPKNLAVLVAVANAGRSATTRSLQLTDGSGVVHGAELTLAPGAIEHVRLDLPLAGVRSLTATLSPPDALTSDDALSLAVSAAELIADVRIATSCGAEFQQAIAAMSSARVSEGADALALDCAPEPAPAAALRIWTGTGDPVGAPTFWTEAADDDLRRIPVPSPPVIARNAPPPGEGQEPILQAGGRGLISAGPAGVDVFFDLTRATRQDEAWFPVLLRALLDLAQDGAVADHLRVARAPDLVSVAPADLARSAVQPPAPRVQGVDLTPVLLLLAAALVLGDTFRMWRHARS